MGSKSFLPATSVDLRQWYADNPKEIPAGAEVSVAVSCKGRVKQVAIDHFNKQANSHGMKYVEGQEATRAVTFKAKNHRMVTRHLPVSEIRALAGMTGRRGPLGKAALVAAGEALRAG